VLGAASLSSLEPGGVSWVSMVKLLLEMMAVSESAAAWLITARSAVGTDTP
jgi:hypothetical protein